jgi:hypothetical protein
MRAIVRICLMIDYSRLSAGSYQLSTDNSRDFRHNSEIPGILVLHYADLPESDVQTAQGR